MAHWIIDDRGFGGMFYTCSNCKSIFSNISKDDPGMWNICKLCDAPIDEENVYTDELDDTKAKKIRRRKDIEKDMRDRKYGVGKNISIFRLIKTVLMQQVLINEQKLAEFERKE